MLMDNTNLWLENHFLSSGNDQRFDLAISFKLLSFSSFKIVLVLVHVLVLGILSIFFEDEDEYEDEDEKDLNPLLPAPCPMLFASRNSYPET
jgi:hypothetical protein